MVFAVSVSLLINSQIVFGVHDQIPSPLKQIKLGLSADEIECKNDLKLVIKIRNQSPACVKPTSVNRLILNGWRLPQEIESTKSFDTEALLELLNHLYTNVTLTNQTENIPVFEEDFVIISIKEKIILVHEYNNKSAAKLASQNFIKFNEEQGELIDWPCQGYYLFKDKVLIVHYGIDANFKTPLFKFINTPFFAHPGMKQYSCPI